MHVPHATGGVPVRRARKGNNAVGILDRISTVLRANINALLDEAEDPEKMLEQIIRDMGEAIADARSQVAEMIAQEKLLEADVTKNRTQSDEWQAKAQLAMQRGREDLAREALTRRRDYAGNADAYGKQLSAQAQVVTRLKSDLATLQSKYDSAVRNKTAMIARHKAAMAQQKVAETARQISAIDPTSELSRMEAKIRQEEARAQGLLEVASVGDIDAEFAALEGDAEIEHELAELKRAALPRGTARVEEHPAPDAAPDAPSIDEELDRLKRSSS